MTARIFWLVLVMVCSVSRWAAARERLAVFVAADDDAALAENLAEVAIAKLAELERFELVGPRELEASLSKIPTFRGQRLAACIATPDCLRALGTSATTARAVVGRVHRRADGFDLDVSLTDTQTGTKQAEAPRSVPGGVTELIGAVQHEVAGLFEPESVTEPRPEPAPAPAAPVPARPPPRHYPVAKTTAPPSAPITTAPKVRLMQEEAPKDDDKLRTYLGLAAAGVAVLAFSAAVISGTLATAPASGQTRGAYQADIERRRDYATAANVSYVAGGVFAVGAVVVLAWP